MNSNRKTNRSLIRPINSPKKKKKISVMLDNGIKINPYKRIQEQLSFDDMFPNRNDGICCCGCNNVLTGKKKRWFDRSCSDAAYEKYAILKGYASVIRKLIKKRDKGICAICHEYDKKWQADHILAVAHGGGGCGLDNFQTLCLKCHKGKTKNMHKI